ncbi:MAG: GTPase [Desulfuromonas sp.]|nr:MAG: GTPase [Desulfuromonas sp.]
MALLNYAKRELNAKVVYYGPGLCGKTTNIQYIHTKLNPDSRGKLLSLATQTDRTLFFDFLPVELGDIKGFKTRFHLYTVPGQVFYNATRKMVLKGVDGIVFVADSQRDMLDANLESFQNLKENLEEYNLSLDSIPYVIQYNKRDLPGVMSSEELDRALNVDKVPTFPASALDGKGVLPTLTTVCKMVLRKLRTTQGLANEDEGTSSRKAGASYRDLQQGKTAAPPAAKPTAAPASPGVPTAPETFPGVQQAPAEAPPLLAVEGCGAPLLLNTQEVALPVTLRHQGVLKSAVVHLSLTDEMGTVSAKVTRVEEKK